MVIENNSTKCVIQGHQAGKVSISSQNVHYAFIWGGVPTKPFFELQLYFILLLV